MKLRTYLLAANAASILVLFIILLFSYRRMLLDTSQFIWLSGATVFAGKVSFFLHFMLVRPIEASVSRIAAGSERIAAGDFQAAVPVIGPAEFKELAIRFNEMGAKLDASFTRVVASEASRRELVASMAHDLRTPLASVLSYVEALEDGVVEDEESFRNYLSTIRAETVRLSRLIRDLFELSTIDAAVTPQHTEDIPLENLLVECLPQFTHLAKEKQVEIRVNIPDPSPVCRCAARQMSRVLQNLLENAVRYAPSGSEVAVEAANEQNGMIRIAVVDRGIGIAEPEHTGIFERFYRVDRSRSRESGGAGIGLSIAKTIVEQHGGQIGVVSTPGSGSAFWFTVPAADGRRLGSVYSCS